MQKVIRMVHSFLELMEMINNQLLPTMLVLLFPYKILLFQKAFYLFFTKTNIQEGTGVGKGNFPINILPPNKKVISK